MNKKEYSQYILSVSEKNIHLQTFPTWARLPYPNEAVGGCTSKEENQKTHEEERKGKGKELR